MIKRMCGIEPKRSITAATASSANLLKLEKSPRIIDMRVLTADAMNPTIRLNPSPEMVLWNMSLPIQSVPKRCSRDGI